MKPKPSTPKTKRPIKRIEKLILARQSWHPCIDEVVNFEGKFVSGFVRVSLMHKFENDMSKVVVSGDDDFYYELLTDKETAEVVYNKLEICPDFKELKSLFGFEQG
jgi:hypothetical protein